MSPRVGGIAVALSVSAALASGPGPVRAQEAVALREPGSFAGVEDPERRSAALFTEAGRVLLHPRCVNCHPSGEQPLQGEDGHVHEPRVRRGDGGIGVVGMRCTACHREANFDPGRVPGDPHWSLAPASMAWEGLSLREICEQVKDPARNGGRDLEAVAAHMRDDSLVGWAWSPGAGREPAPGTWERFAALIAAWADSGAACPAEP